jgi:hypothetical protein
MVLVMAKLNITEFRFEKAANVLYDDLPEC